MSIHTLTASRIPIELWTQVEDLEPGALTKLRNTASLPWTFHHIAGMPDIHDGIGAVVGSVVVTKDAISPATVGVDIACGMCAIRTNINANQLPDNLFELRSRIESRIPTGFEMRKEPHLLVEESGLFDAFKTLTNTVHNLEDKARKQIGTLGGGNHFVEVCLDTSSQVWLMLHSGSRNIGLQLANYHIARAKKLAHNADLPDKDLSVFLAKTKEMDEYRNDLYWAQRYAFLNRKVMVAELKQVILEFFPFAEFDFEVNCHHNFVAEEVHFGEEVFVTRKGAIKASKDSYGIIPGSMGAKSFIVRGLGNPQSFESASHGAGRKMSRTKAKERFTVEDLMEQTRGVECRKDKGVLDEIPGSYKNIDKVMDNQKDLVEIVYELKQIVCVKGGSDKPDWKKKKAEKRAQKEKNTDEINKL